MAVPANTTRQTKIGTMLVQRLRRWSSIEPALSVRLVFAVVQHAPPFIDLSVMSVSIKTGSPQLLMSGDLL